MANLPPVPDLRNREEFRRWIVQYLLPSTAQDADLTALEASVTALTGVVNTNTSNITALSSTVSGNTTDITALEGMAHLRATLTGRAVSNSTWEAVDLTSIESEALCDVNGNVFTLLAGTYDIVLTDVFTGPSDIDFGYTVDGGSNWTTLATSIGSPETILGVTFNAGEEVQFGFFCNTGSGNFNSGDVVITRA